MPYSSAWSPDTPDIKPARVNRADAAAYISFFYFPISASYMFELPIPYTILEGSKHRLYETKDLDSYAKERLAKAQRRTA